MANLDDLDKALLQLLNQDARLPSSQIARQLGQPARTIQNRIQRMVDLGVIRLIGVVNPAHFGYSLTVDIFCELEVGAQEGVVREIMEMPDVTYIAISTGDADLNLQAIFKNSTEMHEFITHKLHQVPGIRHTHTVLIPQIFKVSYQWLPPSEAFASHSD